MEVLNRLADNSDNWQPRKTRYEPCLSVSPTRITRPFPLYPASPSPTAFSTSTSSCEQKSFRTTCNLEVSHHRRAIVHWQKGKKKRGGERRRRRRRNFFAIACIEEGETSSYLLQTREFVAFVVLRVCRIVVDSILINRWGGRKLWCLSFGRLRS